MKVRGVTCPLLPTTCSDHFTIVSLPHAPEPFVTLKEIATMQARSNVPFDLARQIREMLDTARKEYGPTAWEDDDIETKLQELIFGEP